jgi:predicted TPR repeat methyltransferase/Flp pilus assembly protein TadD
MMQIRLPAASDADRSFAAWFAEYPQLRAMLSHDPEPSRALRFLGLKEWSEGRLAAAIRLLTAATEFMPDIAALWSDLGGAYYAMNCLEEARTCTLISLDKDIAQPSAWLLLGTIQSETQNEVEAEAAFLEALRLDPRLATAFAGLGFLYFRQRRLKEAADRLETAIRLGNQVPLVNACLGQALYLLGNFQRAGEAFAIDASVHPHNVKIRKKLALVRFVEAMIREGLQSAVAIYREIAGPDAEDLEGVTRTAFHLLSSYGHHDAAIKLGQARLALAPEDPIQSYLLAAVMREPLSCVPQDYIINYFDKFAESFDAQLVDVLGYTAPEDLHRLLAETRRTFPDVLDLGCGTGLAGPLLRPLAGTLTGVDLSRKMLEKAEERHVYDWLIEGEILKTLECQPEVFELIFAADVLIYFGDLAQLMSSVAQSLKPGGLFAFSIECTRGADYVLLPSGRFAHSAAYIEELARDRFTVVHTASKTFRLEAGAPVNGALYILQRRFCAVAA